jgi:cysteine desulfurase
MAKGIYLDNSMTTRPSSRSVSAMIPFFSDLWGSPSAPHKMGQELFPFMESNLNSIYKLLGAKETDDFILTSSGTEAVNQVVWSVYQDITRNTGKNQFITSNIDEAPAIMAIGRLEQLGCVGKMLDASKDGTITVQAIADAISPRTAMVSLSWANGLTGVINPVAEISKLCKERGIFFHLDATHILGKLFFDLDEVEVDAITFNGDHLHAPKGSGGLWVREGIKISPFILGGMEQGGHRAGCLNLPSLAALGCAAEEAMDSRDLVCTEVARLRNKLESTIVQEISGAVSFFNDQERIPHCTAIGFPGIANEAFLYVLNKKNVFASIGGGSCQQIGLVLAASGIEETLAHTALSFSLSRETHEEDIDKALEIIIETAKQLRYLSEKLIIK